MAGDKSNAQNSGWFTAFTAGGVQMSNSGESSDQSPATAFSAQTAASWLGQVGFLILLPDNVIISLPYV